MRLILLTSRGAGLLTGFALAAAGLLSWNVPGGSGALGADVQITSAPLGELDVSPVAPFLSVTNLLPGALARGELKVRNQTGTELSVRLRALPSLADLDDLLMVRIEAGGELLFAGALADLRLWSERSFRLLSGEQRALRVQTWMPVGTTTGFEGRIADIGLELHAKPAGP